jgi:hypothetical protein
MVNTSSIEARRSTGSTVGMHGESGLQVGGSACGITDNYHRDVGYVERLDDVTGGFGGE